MAPQNKDFATVHNNQSAFDPLMVLTLARQDGSLVFRNLDADFNGHYGPGQLTPLMAAVDAGALENIGFLLRERHVKADARSVDGKTALIFACVKGQLAAVRALLDGGADVNAADAIGMTALMYMAATRPQHATDIVRLLLERGADRTLRNHEGKSAVELLSREVHFRSLTLYGPAGARDPIRALLQSGDHSRN